MVNAQEWLTKEYLDPDVNGLIPRQSVTDVSTGFPAPGLTGALEVKDFPKLQSLSLPCNEITSLKIVNCPKLTKINLMGNRLTSVDFGNYSWGLKELYLSGNDLTDLNFLRTDSGKLGTLKILDLADNKIAAQDLSIFPAISMISNTIEELNIGCTESGMQKGKRNKFFGSLEKLGGGVGQYIKKWGTDVRKFKLNISGTDIDGGLEYLKRETWLDCKPLRTNDKVKTLWDQLAPLKNSSDDTIDFTEEKYKELLEEKRKAADQAAKQKKWEPVKTEYQNILTKISNSSREAKDLCQQAIRVKAKEPKGEEIPDEINQLYWQIRKELNKKFGEFCEKCREEKTDGKDFTDEQLNDLETIITLEKTYFRQLQKGGQITEESCRKTISDLDDLSQSIQNERNRRANSDTTDPNNSQNNNNNGTSQKPEKTIFGDKPINLPTDVGTPPTPKNNQNGPSDNSKDNNKNDNSDQNKDNQPDSTDQKNNEKIINQSKDIEEARENAKKILTEIFQNTAVKLSDLDSSLWKGKKSPEDYLKSLSSKEEIANFIQKLRQSIKAKEEQKNNQSNNKEKKEKEGNALLVFGIIFGVLVGGLVLIVVIRNKRIKKKKWEK